MAKAHWKEWAKQTLVDPGSTVDLSTDFDPRHKDHRLDKSAGVKLLADATAELGALQERLYAEGERALLIVLQAIDAAGKDSTVKHVMSGFNPAGVEVISFKSPSDAERQHDYLWRHQLALPEVGRIAVFNRSHYENVLIVRVHPEMLWPKTDVVDGDGLWKRRFDAINEWERHLTENGTTVVKLFLHLSKEKQAERFLERIDRPEKNWKFAMADLEERARWDDYQRAFDEMLSHTSTEWAPWHVIPADRKWFGRLCTSAVLLETLRDLDPQVPEVDDEARADMQRARQMLVDGV